MSNTLDKLNRITAAALHRMTDEQLQAVAGANAPDLSGLTDTELETVIAGCPGATLTTRIEELSA